MAKAKCAPKVPALPASGPGDQAALRRAPSQKRSRERVERILSVAAALITKQGSDALRMSQVAEQSGVSIGSLYQYFPDKAAILRTLAERYNAEGRACFEAGLVPVEDLASLCTAFDELVDTYYDLFLAEPVIRDIWSGTQADKQLRVIELEHSRKVGDLLAVVLARLWPRAEAVELATRAFLIAHLGEATLRLAVSVERKEGDALIAAYKEMANREFAYIAAQADKRRR